MSEQILVSMNEQIVDSLIIDIFNKFLKANLPAITKKTQNMILENHLDPLKDVKSDHTNIGPVVLSYKLSDLTGLSKHTILKLEIVSIDHGPNDTIFGKARVEADIRSDVCMKVSGSASLGLLENSVTGTVAALPVTTAKSDVLFIVGINGVQLCLKSFDLPNLSIDYGDIDLYINDLGPLNEWLKPLEEFLKKELNGEIKTFIASQVKSAVINTVNPPRCVGLPH